MRKIKPGEKLEKNEVLVFGHVYDLSDVESSSKLMDLIDRSQKNSARSICYVLLQNNMSLINELR